MGTGTSAAKPPKILVVDDQPIVIDLFSAMLADLRVDVDEASSLDEMKARVNRYRYPAIFLDLTLGREDGFQFLEYLRDAHYTGTVTIVSGHVAQVVERVDEVGRRFGLKMAAPILKPVERDKVVTLLASLGVISASATLKLTSSATPTKRSQATLTASSVRPIASADIGFEQALAEHRVEIWYQPKVDLDTFQACGLEALVRLRTREKTVLSPDKFLDRLSSKEMSALTNLVVKFAIGDWKILADKGINLVFSVNAPVSSLVSGEFVDVVAGCQPNDKRWPGLFVEANELQVGPEHVDRLLDNIARLRLHKVDFAIDDLVKVASQYDFYKALGVDELKLDQRFIRSCNSDAHKEAVVNAAVALGQRLNATVTAKGIETHEELRTLRELGCEVGQGHLFARAMPMSQLLPLLSSKAPLYRWRWSAVRSTIGSLTKRGK